MKKAFKIASMIGAAVGVIGIGIAVLTRLADDYFPDFSKHDLL